MNNAAATRRPIPKPGRALKTALSWDEGESMKFVLGRMTKYIRQGCDSHVREQARALIETGDSRSPGLGTLKNIHGWCAQHFVYMDDPENLQILETPSRMIRKIKALRAATDAAMGKFRGNDPRPVQAAPARIGGTSACATVLLLSLARAAGFHDLAIRLGGHEGVLHYAWGQVLTGREWYDVDILNESFGKSHRFECYESLTVPRR